MKKTFRTFLCVAVIAAIMAVAAFASDGGIQVRINGKIVPFADAAPRIESDRTFIPFRGVFEALGFADSDISYDTATKTVKAVKDGKTVSLVVGEKKVSVTENGKTTDIATDVAAFIDPAQSRTYVPARFVAQALGCNVGWDNAKRCVLIDDADAILKTNTATYALMDKYLAYMKTLTGSSYATTGTVKGSLTSEAQGAATKADFSGTVNGVTTGTKSDADMTLSMTGTMTADGKTQTLAAAGIPEKFDFLARTDTEKGTIAFKSDAYMKLLGSTATDTWITMSAEEMGGLGVGDSSEMASLLKNCTNYTSFEAYLRSMLATETLEDVNNTGVDMLAAFNGLFSDAALKKSGDTYTASYTFPADETGAVVSVDVAVSTSGEKVTGCTMTVDMKVPTQAGAVAVKAVVKQSGSNETSETTVNMGTMMNMSIQTVTTYSATTKTAVGAPDAGAKTMTLTELLQGIQQKAAA